MTIDTPLLALNVAPADDVLLSYHVKPSGRTHTLARPVFEIDGVARAMASGTWATSCPPKPLANGAVEHRFDGRFDGGLALTLTVRVADDSPSCGSVTRCAATAPRRLTKSGGADAIDYTACR
jgi:hypothetical protein